MIRDVLHTATMFLLIVALFTPKLQLTGMLMEASITPERGVMKRVIHILHFVRESLNLLYLTRQYSKHKLDYMGEYINKMKSSIS